MKLGAPIRIKKEENFSAHHKNWGFPTNAELIEPLGQALGDQIDGSNSITISASSSLPRQIASLCARIIVCHGLLSLGC